MGLWGQAHVIGFMRRHSGICSDGMWGYDNVLPLAQTAAVASAPSDDPGAAAGVTSYPAAFFATARPNTAFDLIARLPGFTFDPGETLRGFGGAAGNVIVDGQRPSTKADSLESILKRIPASSVLRIDVIRGGAAGIDMQGRAILANIILRADAGTEVTATGAANAYSSGRLSPTVQIDVAKRRGDRQTSGSLRYYEEQGGEYGSGYQLVEDRDGRLLSEAQARLTDIDRGLEARGEVQRPLFGGLAHFNAALDRTGTDKSQLYAYRFPGDRPAEATLERYRGTGGELGGDYTHRLAPRTQLQIVGVQSFRRRTYNSTSDQGGTLSDFSQSRTSGESILRGTVTYTGSPDLSIKGGAEGVYNFLNGRSGLTLDRVPVALPNARVSVSELRAESFATVNWRVDRRWNLEADGRAEISTISQTGDSNKSASFLFAKPRVVVTWSPSEKSQVRIRFQREVSQLDFTDFVATANLATGVVSAGNADLEPERRWVAEVAFERRFWDSGDIVLTLRHSALQQVIDQVPVEGFTAPGNIGTGRRDVAIVDLTLPLARLGLRGGLLKANAQATFSRVTDPTTGRPRRISDDEPFTGTITFTNDLPRLSSTLTASLDAGFRERSFFIDEVQTIRRYPSLDLGWEYKPTRRWSVLGQLTNLARHPRERVRDIYAGLRSANLVARRELLRIRVPAAFYLRVRRTW